MDVKCLSCGEPWDQYYLRHEVVYEVCDDPEPEPELELDAYREALASEGWIFGSTILVVKQCPCCPDDASLDTERAEAYEIVADLLGNDLDGYASTIEDFDPFWPL